MVIALRRFPWDIRSQPLARSGDIAVLADPGWLPFH